ncbi:hypothetical protein [Streptomyces sp. NPDC014676]|uniref:hypothetical protein n=1 Tax=Streptomyces sp. NPDC014676 TaxID=3364879 RepID=UPI0036F8736C
MTPVTGTYGKPGPLGGSVEFLLASLSEDGGVVRGRADEGTAAVALFENSTLADAGKLFVEMRGDLERRPAGGRERRRGPGREAADGPAPRVRCRAVRPVRRLVSPGGP